MKKSFFFVVLVLSISIQLYAGTTGKITGIVKDAKTGETLSGVNVYLENTSLGAATDIDGYYVILNVPPGKYQLISSYIGYKDYIIQNVAVSVDLTTRIDITLNSDVLETDEVVVIAERPVVQKDVAGSVAIISSENIQALPVTSVEEVVGLQAGVTSDLGIRGSSSDQIAFMVDGVLLRDERNNTPITNIPMSAVSEISVQAGGADAQYHNVRSGVVNVVTKEGDPQKYSATLSVKASPVQQKNFGGSPYDADSYYNRPFLDPEVAWTGTDNGAWSTYEQRQYIDFKGWNAVSEETLQDDDPTNDLTPEAAQRIFKWQHRKQGQIDEGDYNIDFGFGGPAPFISKQLGNLRFYGSYRKEKNQYAMSLATDGRIDHSYMLKMTSDISNNMKLSVLGLVGETYATSGSRSGGTSIMTSASGVASLLNQTGHTQDWRIWVPGYLSQTSRYNHSISAKFTHILSSTSFYNAQIKRVGTIYRTGPVAIRDTEKLYEIFPGYFLDEAPFGHSDIPSTSIDGMSMGGSIGNSRDSSEIYTYSAMIDYVNQIDSRNELKAGFEFVYSDYKMNFGSVNKQLPEGNFRSKFKQNPIRLTAYFQDKLEYEGFISTVGFIAEYTDPNDEWYDVDPFNVDFFTSNFDPENDELYRTKSAKARFTISPRLAISHPISETAKLYFNYGHYRQIATSEGLYRVERGVGDKLNRIGDPTISLAKTVSYELGYDHALSNEYLFHLAAYYKDITEQQDWTRYVGAGSASSVNYRQLTNNSYEDIRGFEADITKRYGRWVTGMVNYEYRVNTSGNFDLGEIYLSSSEQREYIRQNPPQQTKATPRPRFKSTIDLHTPLGFGPMFLGQYPLDNWHFNFLTRWTSGRHFQWRSNVQGNTPNMQWNDYFNVDLKISKTFHFGSVDVKFFADILNLGNTKNFSQVSFFDSFDYDDYLSSLHLPKSTIAKTTENLIPGNDQPGDVRKNGVDFVPMEWIANTDNMSAWDPAAIYYDASTSKYFEYNSDNSEWQHASSSRINKIKKDKAYIDMPNHTYFTFLNPRQIFFGINLSYKF
ncbi:MAG: TonB-dependent receptor [Calditrichaeota bacterium]|nr:MAG: TonB-dependent receptor [Calditrichota bacterium]MBL1205415.1 TonB-dependent receptor [Calditrichota bacterium]NOG45244.1 TonB-dependent receptor plug domain-containing protein [Calditrichota bacterium]